jgi:hypothetical protein
MEVGAAAKNHDYMSTGDHQRAYHSKAAVKLSSIGAR